MAEALGVGAALQTPVSLSPQRIAEELVKLLPPHGPDVVIDCAGFDSTLQVEPHFACGAKQLSECSLLWHARCTDTASLKTCCIC